MLPALPFLLLLLSGPGGCTSVEVTQSVDGDAVDMEADLAYLSAELDRLATVPRAPMVERTVLRTPLLPEGAVFELRGGEWVEVASGDAPGEFGDLLRGLDEVRIGWSSGELRVEAPKGAEVVLLVPDPEGTPVERGSTFLRGGALPEGASVLEGRRVRVNRYRAPVELELPFEVARESVVSVIWHRGDVRYEYSDWAAHDWERGGSSRTPPIPVPPAPRRRRGGAR